MSIHPSVILSERAKIDPTAEIGPYCVIEGEVEIGEGTIVESHARIGSRYGRVTIGSNNRIQHGAVLGGPPQDLGYEGGAYTALAIGSNNRIGEFVSINIGTAKGGGPTAAARTWTPTWRTRFPIGAAAGCWWRRLRTSSAASSSCNARRSRGSS